MFKIYDATLPDHSNDDDAALEYARGIVWPEIEYSIQDISTASWRRVGEVDSSCVTVWHDGCESYVFEDCYPMEWAHGDADAMASEAAAS